MFQRNKTPKRMGKICARLEPEKTDLVDLKGKAICSISAPWYCDYGASIKKASISNDAITGTSWRRMVGLDAVIERTWSGVNRSIKQTIHIKPLCVEVVQQITYLDSCDVYSEGFTVVSQKRPLISENINVAGDRTAFLVMNETDIDAYAENSYYMNVFSFQPDMIQTKLDRSWNTYNNGDIREERFQVLFHSLPLQKMLQPNGGLATIIFTNHADGTQIDPVKAIMYGASDLEHENYGNKGFISRGLVTTWSCFYTSDYYNVGLDNSDYATLIDEMYVAGHEIIPHRTKPQDEELRSETEVALPYYKNNFNSRNWIDHQANAGQRNVNMHSRGWDVEDTDYYILDVLETYGYDYVWAYVDMSITDESLNMIRPNIIGLPQYLMYSKNTLEFPSGIPIYQWVTTSRQAPKRLLDYLTTNEVDNLISQFGYTSFHEYFPRGNADGHFYNSGTPYVITEEFDNVLAYISVKQANGEIWNPTQSDWCDYFLAISKVDIEIIDNRTYKITNNSGAVINGFSLRVLGKYVPMIEGVTLDKKEANGHTVFWWNLAVGDTMITLN